MKTIYRAAFGIMLLVIVAQGVGLYLLKRAAWRDHLDAANAKAQLDHTRVRMIEDGLVFERFMQQMNVKLSAALQHSGQVDQALVRMQLERDSLKAERPADVAIDTSAGVPGLTLKSGLDARDSLGLMIAVRTELRGVIPVIAPPTAVAYFSVQREPLLLDVAVSCRDHDAVAQVSGPRWANIDLSSVQARPEICNPKPPAWHPFSLAAPSLPWIAAGVGAGFILRSFVRF